MLVGAAGAVGATAGAEFDAAFVEVFLKLLPFLGVDDAVFVLRALFPAAVEKLLVVGDDVVVWMLRWPRSAVPMWIGRPLLISSVANKRLVSAVAVFRWVRVAIELPRCAPHGYATRRSARVVVRLDDVAWITRSWLF
ncbi:hypothetical protein AB0I53_28140 [Saccharopolyspora sp. NPDC050389]|uniref:hypothetical protein n=1 Tax=Saccharopolyspora sp. NPDC050389 TaxID=3155516 RepID=UPI0033ED9F78